MSVCLLAPKKYFHLFPFSHAQRLWNNFAVLVLSGITFYSVNNIVAFNSVQIYQIYQTQFDMHLPSELLTKRTNKFESARKIRHEI